MIPPCSARSTASIPGVLKEMVDHHIKEEERAIFEELGEQFTDEERVRMGTDFVARKEKLLASTHGHGAKAA